jgi:hypothetical protein
MLSVLVLTLLTAAASPAAEHPGTSVEHPGTAVEAGRAGKKITAAFVKDSIQKHVKAVSRDGVFVIRDEKLNREWRLKLAKIHDPVRKFDKDGRTVYFTCSDFKSVDSKDVLDIDFWMVEKNGGLEVIDTKIHKLNREPRYSYEGTDIKEIK